MGESLRVTQVSRAYTLSSIETGNARLRSMSPLMAPISPKNLGNFETPQTAYHKIPTPRVNRSLDKHTKTSATRNGVLTYFPNNA